MHRHTIAIRQGESNAMTSHYGRKTHHRQPRYSLLAGAVVAGLLTQAAPAIAQQAPVEGATPTELDTIVVTAQGREQDIVAVPYNISAVSGETIEQQNILDTAELMRGVAGVAVVDRGARNSSVVSGLRIRGLNVDSSALGDYAVSATSTVATYVDKTPLFANFLLSDIDRVEVLRGPQGTLYGSGALGGAVRFLLRQPELGAWDARLSGSASSVSESGSIGWSGSGTLNVPVSDTLAMRFNVTVNDFPGATDYRNVYKLDASGLPTAPNGVLDDAAEYERVRDADFVRQNYGRASLLWKPSDRFDATLSYMAQADRFGGRRATSLGSDGWGVPYRDLEVGSVQLEPAARHVNLASLEANIDLGFATLTSSTSSYNHEGDITSENTGFYAQNGWLGFYYNYPRPLASAVRGYGEKAFTQEFRLTSKSVGSFDYVLGAYYQDQDRFATQVSYLRGFKRWWDAAFPGFEDAVISDVDFGYRQDERFKEKALYGELTWHATDRLQFTGGFRHFRHDADTTVAQTTSNWASLVDSSLSQGDESDTRTLFKGNMSWFFTDDSQLYATISEGYRRGGTNGTPTTGNFAEDPAWRTYRSDTVRNHELGVKGRVGKAMYNANLFYVDWKDPQVNSATTFWGFFAVQNAQKASTRGVELELTGSVGAGFTYNLGYTYTKAQLEADAMSVDGAYIYGYKGDTLPGVPEHRFNAAGSYGIPMGNGLLTLRGDVYYQSESENALSLNPKFQRTLDGFPILNASATYSIDKWDVTLWLKNIANEEGISGIYTEQYMGTAPAEGYYGNGSKALVALPRTLGLTVSYRF
ncbi:TonB-dependent receptor [Pseudoxanthomonas japonensis]|uniref:TonB-dependent receptor n=1 Tax=Pseudoxanthomonas japonensis TaxID=69284 RepID=UPI001BCDF7E1|nr:TonB-dependent receptor [Pseudoxanthomonas japonensis]